mmetsp:Transcript_1245/g.2717  ORF Transcript_1245/g.2717 Transcript_1245/m.2717 type:complete len:241 (-) Transcript_1245:121-843(-)
MTDIQYWDDTLSEEIQVIQSQLDRVPGLRDGVEKASAIDKLKKKIRGAKGTKRSFKMEIRLVQDVNQRRKYESRLASLDQQLSKLVADCKAIEAENNRGELFVGGEEGENGNGMSGEEGGDKMLAAASQLQDKTQDSLANTKNMIAQSKEVGMATLEELERQRGVLENIDREADRIDDNLARAEKLLKQFGKRMATDSFIQCFAMVNCLLLLGVVLYAILKGGGLSSGNDGTPKNPALRG